MPSMPNSTSSFHGAHSVLRPDFGAAGLPPLPEIRDPAIRTQVFTHRSFYARPNHVFEDHPSDPSPDNEKYEHLGDTVLGLVITSLLQSVYPNLRVGPATKIRALMVGNATLADVSRRYKLPSYLLLHAAQAITLRASIHIQADVFESYVGGVYLDRGLDVARDWLRCLFTPYAHDAYARVRQEHGLPPINGPPPPGPSSGSTSPASSSPASVPATPSDGFGTPTHLALAGLGAGLAARAGTFVPHWTMGVPRASRQPPTIGHLALFNQHVQRQNREVEWVYSDGTGPGAGARTTPVWAVRVLVDGVELGRGRGNTKKAARNEAAKEGLVSLGVAVQA